MLIIIIFFFYLIKLFVRVPIPITDEFSPVFCLGAVRLPPGIGTGPGNSGARLCGVLGTSHLGNKYKIIIFF